MEDFVTAAAASDDFQFIFPRVCGCDVHDGQRSSLIVQFQSVSESLSACITLNICTDKSEISTDLSDARAAEIPLNIFLLVCFNTSV